MTDTIPAATEFEDIVYALAASPDFTRDGLCFAARASGLSRSEDGGQTWQDAYASLALEAPLSATALALSPDFDRDRQLFAGAPGGIMASADGGQTWQATMLPSPPPLVSSLVVSPNFREDGTVLAGTTEDGVFRSADRGSRWAGWNFGLLDLNVFCLAISPHFAEDETLFAGTDSGIFRSTNGGRAWREVELPAGFVPVLCLTLSPQYGRDGVIFAGTEGQGLLYSEDSGQSWRRLEEAALPATINGVILSPAFPDRPEVLIFGDSLLVSRDRGQSWQPWPGLPAEVGLATVAAPAGLAPGAPLLVGLIDGRVIRL